jgi:YVTN family beta-propeller protein
MTIKLPRPRWALILTSLVYLLATAAIYGEPAAAGGQDSALSETATGHVYTADEHGNSISAIDLATGRVETVAVAISPHNVQITPDGARVLAVGEAVKDGAGHADDGHDAEEVAGRLVVLDALDIGAGAKASIDVGAHPSHVVVDRSGRYAYVTLAGSNALAVVDLVDARVVQTIGTGQFPHGLRISPDGREIYVANVMDGTVSIIDTAQRAEVARVPVGQAPVQVGFTPEGSRIYVSLRDENRVAVIDTASRNVVAKIEVGRGPIQVYATADGREIYVANEGTREQPDDRVSIIDVAQGQAVKQIVTGQGAHGVVVSPDGKRVFVTNIYAGTVSAIDTEKREVIATFAVGKGPNGITFRPRDD